MRSAVTRRTPPGSGSAFSSRIRSPRASSVRPISTAENGLPPQAAWMRRVSRRGSGSPQRSVSRVWIGVGVERAERDAVQPGIQRRPVEPEGAADPGRRAASTPTGSVASLRTT